MRNRNIELELAEKHYLAAIAVLTPHVNQEPEHAQESLSPTSSESESEGGFHRRPSDAGSLHSNHSISTTATSVHEEDTDSCDQGRPRKKSVTFADAQDSLTSNDDANRSPNTTKRRPRPINTSITKAESSHNQKLSAELSSFANMIKTHLEGVRNLKDSSTVFGHRYSLSHARSSTSNSRPVSRSSGHEDAEKDHVRWQRKSMSFRPRFDPTTVRKLCAEAINEL